MNTYCLVQEIKLLLYIQVFWHLKPVYCVFMHFGTLNNLLDTSTEQIINEPMYLSTSFNNYQYLSILFALFSSIIFFRSWIASIFCILLCYVNNIRLRHSSLTQRFCWLFRMFIHVSLSSCKNSFYYYIEFHCMRTLLLIHSPVDWHLNAFQFHVLINISAINIFLMFPYASVWEFLYYMEVK